MEWFRCQAPPSTLRPQMLFECGGFDPRTPQSEERTINRLVLSSRSSLPAFRSGRISQRVQHRHVHRGGNFCTFPLASEQFDLVIFNGSLEYIGSPDSFWKTQCAAMREAARILKHGGLVYVGIENSLGLKYLLDAPDDHTGIRGSRS